MRATDHPNRRAPYAQGSADACGLCNALIARFGVEGTRFAQSAPMKAGGAVYCFCDNADPQGLGNAEVLAPFQHLAWHVRWRPVPKIRHSMPWSSFMTIS